MSDSDSSSSRDSEYESPYSERPDESDNGMDEDATLKQQLASWQVKNHVPLLHCDELLRILKPYHPELPRCARTLIRTQRATVGRLLSDVRAMVTCTKGHTSERHGCSRCTGNGKIVGQLRSNESFRNKTHPDHHQTRSIIENLTYFDMMLDVPLDPMHLFDLSIMRRILLFLFPNNKRRNIPGVTLHPQVVRNIDEFLISLRKCISRIDFARQPRSVKELPRWKAT